MSGISYKLKTNKINIIHYFNFVKDVGTLFFVNDAIQNYFALFGLYSDKNK